MICYRHTTFYRFRTVWVIGIHKFFLPDWDCFQDSTTWEGNQLLLSAGIHHHYHPLYSKRRLLLQIWTLLPQLIYGHAHLDTISWSKTQLVIVVYKLQQYTHILLQLKIQNWYDKMLCFLIQKIIHAQ